MDVLLAHSLPVRRGRLEARLKSGDGLHLVATARDLTETWDAAEHLRPDVVVISAELAAAEEFDCLGALLDAEGIGCLVLAAAADGASAGATVRSRPGLALLRTEPEAEEFFDLIRRQRRTRPIKAARVKPTTKQVEPAQAFDPQKLILIGSSTGGVDALLKLLTQFPADCPPVVVLQHTGAAFAASLIRLLDSQIPPRVVAATDGMPVQGGHVYMAPGGGEHLELARGTPPRLCLRQGPPISGHVPSVDALFTSARPLAQHCVAAILTGMGRDGAEGLLALRQGGARTIAQDEASAVVYGMPRVAWEIGAAEEQLPLSQIGSRLLKACRA